MRISLLTLSIILINLYLSQCQWFFGQITHLQRTVDLTSTYVESQVQVRFHNNNNQAVYSFFYAIPDYLNSTLVHVLVDDDDSETIMSVCTDPLYTSTATNYTIYQYDLPRRILPDDSQIIKIKELYLNRLQPWPKKIDLREPQFVLLKDSKYFFSPYNIKEQVTIYITGAIRSYTQDPEDDTVTERKNQIIYGKYFDKEPFQESEIQLHVENSTPLAQFTEVQKNIDVSHWGNIAINNNFKVVNVGAGLRGEFERVNRNFQGIARTSLKGLHAEIPYHAWGVSYGDEIGNISTSNAWRSKDDKVVHVDVYHRFPILGGWKSNFYLNYNLNTSRYIYEQDTNQYVLKQLFSYPFLDLIAEDYEVSVALPQGAYDIDVTLPFDVDNQSEEITYSYLDTKGRPTLIFNKKMVSAFHNQFFYINYKLDPIELYRKPAILFLAFTGLFFVLIIVNRMDSSNRSEQNKDSDDEDEDETQQQGKQKTE